LISQWCDDPAGKNVTMAELQRMTSMSAVRLRKARDWLEANGLLKYDVVIGRAVRYFLLEPGVIPKPPPQPVDTTVDEPDEQARAHAIAITKRWWARSDPKPLIRGGFPAAMKMIERAIVAGWRPEDVEAAVPLVPTLTAASLEYQLRKKTNTSAPGVPGRSTTRPTPNCPTCGSSGRYRSEAGWRCVGCDEMLEV
jgi:hypothetical protein